MFNKFFSFFDGKIKSDPNDPDYLNNIKKCPGLAGLLIEHWEAEAKLTEPVVYDYNYHEGFTIYTNHPGYLIGKGGSLINKYRIRLKEEFGKNSDIKFVEIKNGFVNY